MADNLVEDGGFNYGALAFSPPDGPPESRQTYGEKETLEGDLLALFPSDQHGHWREWIGSLAWSDIRRSTRIVIVRRRSDTSGVLDGEDQDLRRRVESAWAAFLLAGASHSDRPAWIISGQAGGVVPGAPLFTIRSAQPQDRIVHPYYESRERYIRLEAAAMADYWSANGARDQSWFPLWMEVDELLSRRTPRPPILGYALLGYWSAWTRRLLEFSIPEFVRAAEGLIALPPRTGRVLFRDRALSLAPRLRADAYVGANIEGLLLRLYDLRSDCVHGKVPFHDMQTRGGEGQEEAAQLNYVAEVLAREALLLALRRPDWAAFSGREELQQAWASGAFP